MYPKFYTQEVIEKALKILKKHDSKIGIDKQWLEKTLNRIGFVTILGSLGNRIGSADLAPSKEEEKWAAAEKDLLKFQDKYEGFHIQLVERPDYKKDERITSLLEEVRFLKDDATARIGKSGRSKDEYMNFFYRMIKKDLIEPLFPKNPKLGYTRKPEMSGNLPDLLGTLIHKIDKNRTNEALVKGYTKATSEVD
ncbi:hypothetical protein N9470_03085 [Emcibacteraceae bacterium]|nr:hypothetical protein [Emcibacteraceae bacterium]